VPGLRILPRVTTSPYSITNASAPGKRSPAPALDFRYTTATAPHRRRAREILAKHPHVKDLEGNDATSALWVVGIVGAQWAIAWALAGQAWYWVLPAAWLVGAFFSHGLYVLIHECTHNLVLRNKTANNLLGIFCDTGTALPGAMGFRKFHLLHHQMQGDLEMDLDVVGPREARLVGNSTWRKAVWMAFLGISQALRPRRLKNVKVLDRWMVLDAAVVVAFDVAVLLLLGPVALGYLVLSTIFALGLHPLGGRWIQEHYITREDQETYSYYGPLNRVAFNVGYHNEHHDFFRVPWRRLPALKAAAPEFYDGLKSYRSWTAVLLRFVFDPSMSTYSRLVRARAAPASAPAARAADLEPVA
jgi:sphingolipid delta-4 desaturase